MIRVNLGSGKDYREGYKNVEINRERFKADIYADIRDVEFEEGTVSEVLAQDVIDHITFMDAKALLRRIYGWLKPNGVLNIHTPNLKILGAEAALGNSKALEWLYGTSGEGNTDYATNIIRWCYSPKSMEEVLERLGFKILQVMPTCGGFAFRIIAVKKQ